MCGEGRGCAVQAEKARQAEALQGVHDAHAREISSLRAELDQERTRERERQDDSSRVHEELLAVRGELAQARADNERAYHEQLLPTQVLPLPPVCGAPVATLSRASMHVPHGGGSIHMCSGVTESPRLCGHAGVCVAVKCVGWVIAHGGSMDAAL